MSSCAAGASIGSGVIVDARRGFVLTGYTDGAGSAELSVLLLDGRPLDAQVLGGDATTDVAVLRIEADNLDDARPSQPVPAASRPKPEVRRTDS